MTKSQKKTCSILYRKPQKTNRNNMNIVMRAVKSVSAYLSKQQLIKIEIDWDVFRPATSPLHLIAPYTQEEITRMLEVIESHSKTPLRGQSHNTSGV